MNGRRRGNREESLEVSTRFILSMENEQVDAGRDCRTRLASILRRERGQENIHFPCSADHEQDWQPYPVDPSSCYLYVSDDFTLIHTYKDDFQAFGATDGSTVDNRLTFGVDRAVWTLAAKMDDGAPWHKGVLQGAEKFMASWHKEEEEASRRRATKRYSRDLEPPTHL